MPSHFAMSKNAQDTIVLKEINKVQKFRKTKKFGSITENNEGLSKKSQVNINSLMYIWPISLIYFTEFAFNSAGINGSYLVQM